MARLPNPGSDEGVWGDILNVFLSQSHNSDGTFKANSVGTSTLANGSVTNAKLDAPTQANLTKANTSVQSVNAQLPDGAGNVALSAADVGAPTTLAGDSDVAISSPANLQVLTYSSGPPGKWTNQPLPGAPVLSVAGKTGNVTIVETDVINLSSDLAARATVTNGGGEAFFDIGSSGSSLTVNLVNGNVQKLTLTANCTLTFTPPTAGAMRSLTFLIFQDGTGSRTIMWPGSVKWGAAGVPVLSTTAGKMDIISLFTVDGGTTWYGVAGAQGF